MHKSYQEVMRINVVTLSVAQAPLGQSILNKLAVTLADRQMTLRSKRNQGGLTAVALWKT